VIAVCGSYVLKAEVQTWFTFGSYSAFLPPGLAQLNEAVQGPHAEHGVDLPLVLRHGEHPHEQGADGECADGMNEVGAGAHGDEAGEQALVHAFAFRRMRRAASRDR
jgi:hypothetical protein